VSLFVKAVAMKQLFLFGLLISSLSFADSPALPTSYVVESENGKFVFAMISPLVKEEEIRSLNDEWGEKALKIRNKYPKSGMYLKSELSKPIWTVDWYAFSVKIGNNGEYIVRDGPWASTFEDEAVTFFKNGVEIKTYKIKGLVKKKRKVERTVSHFFWRNETLFDRKQLKYYISTLDSKHYVFNVESGEIITGRR